jgi:hypothetical protein
MPLFVLPPEGGSHQRKSQMALARFGIFAFDPSWKPRVQPAGRRSRADRFEPGTGQATTLIVQDGPLAVRAMRIRS